jgi:hypothetical protein
VTKEREIETDNKIQRRNSDYRKSVGWEASLDLGELAETAHGAVRRNSARQCVAHERKKRKRKKDAPPDGRGSGGRDGPGATGGGLLARLAVPDTDSGALDGVLFEGERRGGSASGVSSALSFPFEDCTAPSAVIAQLLLFCLHNSRFDAPSSEVDPPDFLDISPPLRLLLRCSTSENRTVAVGRMGKTANLAAEGAAVGSKSGQFLLVSKDGKRGERTCR